jgi:hypothetical protein
LRAAVKHEGGIMLRHLKTPRGFVAGLVVGAALVGGIAYAAIPDANGVIHGCVSNSTGGLRAVDPAASSPSLSACKNNETAVDWNQQGPTGATGPAGPPGSGGALTYNVAPAPTHVTESPGPMTDVLTFGPFTFSVNCNVDDNGTVTGTYLVHSTDAGAQYYGRTLGDGRSQDVQDYEAQESAFPGDPVPPTFFNPVVAFVSPATGMAVTARPVTFLDVSSPTPCRFFGTFTPIPSS